MPNALKTWRVALGIAAVDFWIALVVVAAVMFFFNHRRRCGIRRPARGRLVRRGIEAEAEVSDEKSQCVDNRIVRRGMSGDRSVPTTWRHGNLCWRAGSLHHRNRSVGMVCVFHP
jgi:hypothetical protein